VKLKIGAIEVIRASRYVIERVLGGAPGLRICPTCIQPVLEDIQVERPKVFSAEELELLNQCV